MFRYLVIRVTLKRSNPQWIRVLQVPVDAILTELQAAVLATLGWSDRVPCTLQAADGWRYEKEIPKEYGVRQQKRRRENLPDTVSGEELRTLSRRKADPLLPALLLPGEEAECMCGHQNSWEMRLEALEERQYEKEPENFLLRFHGDYNPSELCDNPAVFNRFCLIWMGIYRRSYWDDTYQEEDCRFYPAQVNDRLSRLFLEDTSRLSEKALSGKALPPGFVPPYNSFFRTESLLMTYTLAQLQQVAERIHIRLTGNKTEKISQIKRCFCERHYVESIANSLSDAEYEMLLDLMRGPVLYRDEMRPLVATLADIGCLGITRGSQLVLSCDFAKTFMKLYAEGFYQEERARVSTVSSIIVGGCLLYTALSFQDRRLLADHCYHGLLKEKELSSLTEQFVNGLAGREFGITPEGVIFRKEEIGASQADQLAHTMSKFPAYLPAREELEELVQNGYRFPPDTAHTLRTYLTANMGFTLNQAGELEPLIYRLLHLGWEPRDVVKRCFEMFSFYRSSKVRRDMAGYLGILGCSVRKSILHGHMEKELNHV